MPLWYGAVERTVHLSPIFGEDLLFGLSPPHAVTIPMPRNDLAGGFICNSTSARVGNDRILLEVLTAREADPGATC